jgi:hypothetical protein
MGEECSTSQFRPWPASFGRAVIIAIKQSDSPEAILTGEDGIDDFANLWPYCAGWPD